jgi:hypothetical protein
MLKAARPLRLCVLFAEQLDILLDRLNNRRMMHDFQSIIIDCWCRK